MSEEVIPLFPLKVVLFPDSALPLHIFEERHKLLIGRSMASGTEFGINLVDGSTISAVGCSARVRNLIRRYPDGRMDVIVRGGRRYRLDRYESRTAPYLVGSVEFLESRPENRDDALREETLTLYHALMAAVYRGDNRYGFEPPATGSQLSFLLAQKSGMDLPMRQQLLELDSENDRLRFLREYLVDVLGKVERVGEIERIIQSDGYV